MYRQSRHIPPAHPQSREGWRQILPLGFAGAYAQRAEHLIRLTISRLLLIRLLQPDTRCCGPFQVLTPIHWGLLQQPDKHEVSSLDERRPRNNRAKLSEQAHLAG